MRMRRFLLSITGALLGLAVYYYLPQEGRHPGHPVQRPESAPVRTEASRSPDPADPADPAINLEHVFEGEINRRGKPVGFHSRPGGTNPDGARVVRIVEKPNKLGVYIADVEIRSGSGRWLRKRSTFYPDSMSRDEVLAAIRNAWEERRDLGGDKFQGPSGTGFTIEGYTLDDGSINTAYPLYRR